MENFNLEELELDLEGDFDLDSMFELNAVEEDTEVIEEEHFKLPTKDFLGMLKRAKTVISSSARDLITKAICMEVVDGVLTMKCTDFDVFLELRNPIMNTNNVLEEAIICPIDSLIQVARALPATTVILKDAQGKIRIRLIGGSIDLETLSVGVDKFTMKDEVAEDKDIDAQDLYNVLTAFSPIVAASVNPMEKRIVFDENGARAVYMFSLTTREGNYPKFDVKVKDLSVLKTLLSSAKGNLKTFRTVNEKASSRFIIEGDTFRYTFLVGEANINRILADNLKESDFTQGAFLEFTKISKLVELSSSLNYATGKVKMKFTESNVLQLHVPTKNGDNTFKLDATPNGNLAIGVEVEVPAKLFLTILKAFQKRSVITLYCDAGRILLSNDDFKGLILLNA